MKNDVWLLSKAWDLRENIQILSTKKKQYGYSFKFILKSSSEISGLHCKGQKHSARTYTVKEKSLPAPLY